MFKNISFRFSWFIIYGIFVLLVTIICCVLLFTLDVFKHTNFLLVFLLIFLYSLSVIMFAFMITPFFDKSRVRYFLIFHITPIKWLYFFFQTAGIVGNFAVTITSLLYFIQVFFKGSSSWVLWLLSLINSTGCALALDNVSILHVNVVSRTKFIVFLSFYFLCSKKIK